MAETIEAMNEFIRAYAEKKGITPTEALLEFKKNFLHRSEVVDMMQNSGPKLPRIIGPGSPTGSGELDETRVIFSEQAKVEIKRLELEQKRVDAEQKRLDLETRKQELAEKKLEMDERLRREELRDQRQQKDEEHRIERDRASTERMLLLSNISGKKQPDELMELFKEQGKSTKEFYDKALQLKDSERDREVEWRKFLATTEADRDVELAKIKEEADAETASQTDLIIQKMDEKFGPKVGELKSASSADDFITKMEEYKKMQDKFLNLTFDTLEARGFDKEQLTLMKKAAKIEEKKQDGTADRLWELGKRFWKDYVEPEVDKAKKELEPPQPTPTQTDDQRRAEEARIRKEVEDTEKQLSAENVTLQRQLENEKKALALQRQRQGLETRASELGIPFGATTTDQQLYDLIVQEESLNSQVIEERQKLVAQAHEIGLTFDPSITNSQLFNEIEMHEAIREREIKIQQNNEALLDKDLKRPEEEAHDQPHEEVPEDGLKETVDENAREQKQTPQKLKKKREKEPEETDVKRKVKRFLITKDDGTQLCDTEASNAYGAAMKLPVIGGTDPIKIKVQEEGSDKIVDYEVYMDGKNRQRVRKPEV